MDTCSRAATTGRNWRQPSDCCLAWLNQWERTNDWQEVHFARLAVDMRNSRISQPVRYDKGPRPAAGVSRRRTAERGGLCVDQGPRREAVVPREGKAIDEAHCWRAGAYRDLCHQGRSQVGPLPEIGRSSNVRSERATNLNFGGSPFGHGAIRVANNHFPISWLMSSRH